MRLLIVLFSAFLAALSVGGLSVRAAETAPIAASVAEPDSLNAVVASKPATGSSHGVRSNAVPAKVPDMPEPAAIIPLYANRLRL